jgi:NAD(P)H-dependent FMN reductase
MKTISIISPSVRRGRNSHRVALFLKHYIEENNLAKADIIDLKEYNFPLFDERLKYQENPSKEVLQFAEKIRSADGVIIVAPEYNGGYTASLKNVIDLLTSEWQRKPVAITTVSDGHFGGSQVITSLQFVLWKMRAWVAPARFPVTYVGKTFNENGVPADREETDKRAASFISELLWFIEARSRMND